MTKKRVKKKEDYKPLMIIAGIVLALLVLSYIVFGIGFTIFIAVGIAIILGIARLLDKIKSKPKQRKTLNIILIVILSIAILICVLAAAFITMIVIKSPEFDVSRLDKKEASIFYASDGTETRRVGAELRENVTYDDLPEVFIDALVATEDSRFFQHNGFDAPRFIKASAGQALGNSKAGGASTLTMQVAKNTYTSLEAKGIEGIIRKFTDIYIAIFKLEKNFTKEEIIEYYVNNQDLGYNSFGVEQASQTYFGKSVRDLNLSESALIVGMFNAPTANNPFNNPSRAYSRRATVLSLMVRHGYITQAEADAANAIPITSLLAEKTENLQFQGYIDTVIEELKDKYGINPNLTPVLVYTNMNREKQQALDDIFNGKTYNWENEVVQSGVSVIEVATGKLIAVGAGRNKKTALSWNFSTQTVRQIGSTAKPIFDYGPALEYLNWSTYTQIVDEPWAYNTGQSIKNSDGQFWGQMSTRKALAQSRNIPALKAFQEVQSQVGNKKILEFAQNLGMTPQVENGKIYESHSLGAFDGTTPQQMAAAYAAFANGGTYIEPTTVNKIIFRDTNDIKTIEPETKKAMSDSTAFMITDMLVTAVNSGLSSGAKINGVNLAAKTGTTNFDAETKKANKLPSDAVNDAWIVGYDPEYSVSMWYGYDKIDSKYVNREVNAVIQRGRLYRAIGNVIFNKNGKTFEVPSSVVKVGIEDGSNPPALPSASTPKDQITYEYFKKGTEPTETSSKYNKLSSVKNLKVTYNKDQQKINVTWTKLNTPTANESYGEFGYNVYYGDVLLGFTTDNTYTISANSNISGTYKVVTTFSKYTGNQSNPATFNFEYDDGTKDTYTLALIGASSVSISNDSSYVDKNPPVDLLKNGTSINNQVDFSKILKTVIKDPSGTVITSISGTAEKPLAAGKYTITYTVNHAGKTLTKTREVIVP